MGIEETATVGVGIAITVVLIAALITSAGNYIENVDSTQEWNDAIDEAQSANYEVNDGVVTLQNSGEVVTSAVNISDNSNVTFETTSLNGTATVTVYDGADSQVASGTLSGEDSFTADLADSVDEYNVEFTTDSTSTAEVESYSTKEPSDGIAGNLGLLVIGVIGVGILFMLGKI